MHQLGDFLQRLQCTCRCFRMNEAHYLGGVSLDRRSDFLGIEHFAERAFNCQHIGSGAAGDIGHSPPEYPVDPDDHPVTRLNQVHDAGLHPGTSGTADGQRQPVLRLKHGPQHCLCFIHDPQEIGVEMPDRRCSHRGQYTRSHIAGAGAHQDSPWRLHRRVVHRCVFDIRIAKRYAEPDKARALRIIQRLRSEITTGDVRLLSELAFTV